MPKIRKKDPCPCGSGKKYKDCCFKEMKQAKKENPHIDLAEALGISEEEIMNRLEEMAKTLETGGDLSSFLKDRWTREKVAEMSTEEIIDKLHSMNVIFDKDEFKTQAKPYISAIEVAEDFYYTQDWQGKEDEDFIWIAIIELWNRLVDTPNLEVFEDLVLDGYDDWQEEDYENAIARWEKAWDILTEIIPSDITSIKGADHFVDNLPKFSLTQSLFNWCQDVDDMLVEAGLKDKSLITKRIQYTSEFCQRFPCSDICMKMLIGKADSYKMLGDIEKAEGLFEELAGTYPENSAVYTGWGDVCEKNKNFEKAEQIYTLGLKHCSSGRDKIYERLKALKMHD